MFGMIPSSPAVQKVFPLVTISPPPMGLTRPTWACNLCRINDPRGYGSALNALDADIKARLHVRLAHPGYASELNVDCIVAAA